MPNPMTPAEQFQCLNLLVLISDLFTASKKETFTRVELLVIFDGLRGPDLFDPEVLIIHQEAHAESLPETT